ncbi:MAG TPA: hypothetical protein VHO71_06490 [Caproiciproducens sp.]|nr:hypothetical protein [Caproiciproducens sp.]
MDTNTSKIGKLILKLQLVTGMALFLIWKRKPSADEVLDFINSSNFEDYGLAEHIAKCKFAHKS